MSAIAGERVDSAELDDIAAEIEASAAIFVPVIKMQEGALAEAEWSAKDQVKLLTVKSEQLRRELAWQAEAAEEREIEARRQIEAVREQVADIRRANDELAKRLEERRTVGDQSPVALAARKAELEAFQVQLDRLSAPPREPVIEPTASGRASGGAIADQREAERG
jgi:chromosome segregation ATPase